MALQRIVNVSGGKDSTALYLLAIEHGRPFIPVFADVGNEAKETYEYIRELPRKTGGPEIRWVTADTATPLLKKAEKLKKNYAQTGVWKDRVKTPQQIEEALAVLKPTGIPFLDACLTRGGFPSGRMRFCTDKLKIEPICKQVYLPLLEEGHHVVSWQGVRAEESAKRSVLSLRGIEKNLYDCRFHILRPLLHWKVEEVFAFIKRHGLEPNPLYAKGSTRVGCWPCIFSSSKADIRSLAEQDPGKIKELDRWESLVSKSTPGGESTFFMAKNLKRPGPYHHTIHGINEQVKWAYTRHGGEQYALFFERYAEAQAQASEVCAGHGLCE